jgi:8-oxo-dGTP diphosphatase
MPQRGCRQTGAGGDRDVGRRDGYSWRVAGSSEEFARPRAASGALFFDHAGRVMLVRPTYKPMWDIPGGYVESGESPAAALRREITEELGTALPVGGLLVVDWAPHPAEGDKLLFVFDGGVLASEQVTGIRVDGTEISEFTFRSPGELSGMLIPRLARRVHAAIGARAAGQVAYLEHGTPPGNW